MSVPAEDKRRRKERLAKDLEEALAGASPTQDELIARPAKRGPRIQGITAREYANRIGVQYQTVLVWLRDYDPEFPAEHNWPKLADVMGISLDEFRARYLFATPPARPAENGQVEELARQVDDLRHQIGLLQQQLEGREERRSS